MVCWLSKAKRKKKEQAARKRVHDALREQGVYDQDKNWEEERRKNQEDKAKEFKANKQRIKDGIKRRLDGRQMMLTEDTADAHKKNLACIRALKAV